MTKPIVHLQATYYRPSWQGGDLILARCQIGAVGFSCEPSDRFELSELRSKVTCIACNRVRRPAAEGRTLAPREAASRPPALRPTVPAVVTTAPVPSIEIMREVAERAGLTLSELKSATRVHRVAHPRQEAMWEMRQRTRLSLVQIAHRCGLKDHTSARWGILQHQARLDASQRPSA